MTTVGRAEFELLGDSTEFRNALAKASASLEEWGAEAAESAGKAVAGLGRLAGVGAASVASLERVGSAGHEASAGLLKVETAAREAGSAAPAMAELEVAGLEIVHAMDAAGASAKRAGEGFKKTGDDANNASPKIKSFSDRLDAAGSKLESAGRRLSIALTLPLLALGGIAVKTASDFESSFAGIRKTMNLTEGQFGKLAQANRDLAKDIPVTVNELNRIGELGGQLGIRGVENIVKFERTIAQLAVTTDLTADAAALSFAQIANILQLPQSQIDRLGATVVDLGNNFATVESKIVEFTQRIAGAGQLAGLSAGSVAGIGTALASLGVEAEAGGTAVQKVLIAMITAVSQGGAELEAFAKAAGVTSAEFAKTFREDAGEAFLAFVEGLGRQGEAAIGTLEELGLTDQRLTRSFLAAAGAGDLLRRAMEKGNTAWAANTALVNEAEKRFETFRSQLTLAWNRVKDTAITLGNALLPALLDLLTALGPLVSLLGGLATVFASTGDGMRTVALATAAVVAGLGPMLIVGGALAQALVALNAAAIALNITLSTGALGLLAAGVGLIVGFTLLARSGREAAKELKAVQDATKNAADQSAGYASKVELMTAAAKELERLRLIEALARQHETLAELRAEADRLEPVLQRLTGTGEEFVAASKRETGLKEELAATEATVARLDDQYKSLLTSMTAAANAPPPGENAGAGSAERVKEIVDELRVGLASAERLGTLFGSSFDVAAEKADVLRNAIQGLVEENVALTTKVGPQGQTLGELVALYNETAAAVTATEAATRALTQAENEAAAITKAVATPMEEWRATAAALDSQLAAGRITLETYLRALDNADAEFRKTTGSAEKQVKEIEALAKAHAGGAEAVKAHAREQFVLAEIAKLGTEASVEQIARTREAAGAVFDATKDATTGASDMAKAYEAAGRRMENAIVEFASSGKLSIRDFVADALKEIGRLQLRLAALQAFEFFKPGGGRSKGGKFDAGGFFKDLAIAVGSLLVAGKVQGKATGGPVFANHPYIVGERGKELFIPSRAGTIVPNDALGGGGGGSPAAYASAILSRLPPLPAPMSPEAAAQTPWYRRLIEEMAADGMMRGVRFG